MRACAWHLSMRGGQVRHAAWAQEHVKREKQVMAECDCSFMVTLVTSFKDEAHLYMLMECIMGGELFTHLQAGTHLAWASGFEG